LRPFKSFLVALNITESGTTKPHRVKWSDSADPGTVPSSWDETDATKDTGEVDLTDVNSGPILEGLPFGAVFMIYKEDSVWSMRFVGGQSIFAFSNILTTSGILGARCVASVDKGKLHFLHTGDDLVAFDGQDVISVIDKKLRRFLLSDLDSANFENSFCFDNVALDEACFVYPTNGQTLPDKCVVWNYRDNTTSVRAFQGNFAALGIIEELTAGDWNSDTEAWDNDLTPWSEALRRQILVPDSANTKLYQLEVTDQANGVDMTSFLERTGLGVVGKDRQGNPKVDIGVRKLVRRIWPKIRGGPVNIQVGVQEEIDGVITYQPAQSFDPATQKYLDFTANGRLIAVRFDATCNCSWQLEGYDLELEVLGEH